MRRKDREMSREFALKLIDKAPYGIISMTDAQGLPYGLPISIVRHGDFLYFHSAQGGKKVEAFEKHQEVSVTFVGQINIPELFTKPQLDEFLSDRAKASTLISRVFTTEYESALVFGSVTLVVDEAEATEAMRMICQKYTPEKMDYFDIAIAVSLQRTAVYRISMEQVTAKRKKFDSRGEELKWGRQE